MKKLAFVLTVAYCGMAWAFNPVANVVAKQGSLGSGLVEISFDLATVQDEATVTISAVDAVKSVGLPVKTLQDAEGKKLENPCTLKAGVRQQIFWDALADLGKTFYSSSVSITVKTAVTKPTAEGLYCVIDLSSGPNSTRYPVTYLNEIPGGAWSDEYKTTKLVLKKLPPGEFMLGGTTPVTLTKHFYMGVFEVTEAQYALVMGSTGTTGTSAKTNVSYKDIRGVTGTLWPLSTKVDEGCFVDRLRKRTGIDFDLPTEEQWEYACTTAEGISGMLTDPMEWCIDGSTRTNFCECAWIPVEGIAVPDERDSANGILWPSLEEGTGGSLVGNLYFNEQTAALVREYYPSTCIFTPIGMVRRILRGDKGSAASRMSGGYDECGYGFRLSWTVQ